MKINIRAKITAGFFLILMLFLALSFYAIDKSGEYLKEAIGKKSVVIAEEIVKRIDQNIYSIIKELQVFSRHQYLKDAANISNTEFEKLRDVDGYINTKEREWRSVPKAEITPFMQDIIGNDLSDLFRRELIEFYEKENGYRIFSEVFLTNRFGANIAQTGKTTDYRQNDEKWWNIAKDRGLYVSQVEFDESSNVYAVSIGIRVDDDNEIFSGVIKAVIHLKGIIRDTALDIKRPESTVVKLITKEGQLIYSSEPFTFLEDVDEEEYFKNMEGERGFFTGKLRGKEKVFSYVLSEGYKHFAGEKWILLMEHDVKEILKPIYVLTNKILTASFVLIIIGIVIIYITSGTITEPLKRLMKGTEIIGKGNLEYTVDIKTGDETGELSLAFNEMAKNLKAVTASRDELNKEIAERKYAEKKLRQFTEKLEHSNQELKQFLSIASHDLQEPVRKVLTFASLLELKYLDRLGAQGQDILSRIQQAAERMQALNDDLRLFSEVTSVSGHFIPVDLKSLAREAVTSLKIPIKRANGDVEIGDLAIIDADPKLIHQLFMALISNAIKFCRKDRSPVIKINGKTIHSIGDSSGISAPDYGYYQILIQDNGIGFHEKYVDRIFEVFQRLHIENGYEGTGIGLAICRKIVEYHEGRITAKSTPGQGSTFIITLPVKQLKG